LKQERFIKKESTDFADSEPTEKLVSKIKNGKPVKVQATAYCINNITASGVRSKFGILAADPKYLPIGSIVRLHAAEYSGLYTVLDTGAKIKGKRIDIFLTNPKEAVYFGRRDVKVEVLRYGWNPQSSPINY
jgi:3D (Asp-Asp-Asp) domain-containing protein